MTTDSLRAALIADLEDHNVPGSRIDLGNGEDLWVSTLWDLSEWVQGLLAAHPLSGGGVGFPGALPLGTEQGEETPTPPPLTVDRRRIWLAVWRVWNSPHETPIDFADAATDAVVAELAAGRTVIDLNEAKAEALRAEAQWFRDGAQSPTAGPSGRIVAMAMADEIDKHADALDGGGTD